MASQQLCKSATILYESGDTPMRSFQLESSLFFFACAHLPARIYILCLECVQRLARLLTLFLAISTPLSYTHNL